MWTVKRWMDGFNGRVNGRFAEKHNIAEKKLVLWRSGTEDTWNGMVLEWWIVNMAAR